MDNKILSKIASFFFSTRLMAVLFLGFALAMGIGTFIENEYNTDTARIWIYNTKWFEAIMFIFMINFIGNIKRYQLFKKEKWATLLLHLSFILILLGAFITRYISFEGMMPIKEGESSNEIFSERVHLTAFVDGDYNGEMKRKTLDKALILSPVTDNSFSIKDKFDQTPFQITYVDYIMGATETIEEDPNGKEYIKLVEAGEGSRHEHYLIEGEVVNIHNVLFALNKETKGAININTKGDQYTINMPFEGQFMRMADQLQGQVYKDSVQPLMMRSLYSVGEQRFVFPEPAIKGKIAYKSNNNYKEKNSEDALIVDVKVGDHTQRVTLLGSKGKMGVPQTITLGDFDFTLMFGSKIFTTPFKIKLNDFIAEKYPGTEKSYSSYESKVTVEDEDGNFDARIYMNNVLDHKGYRFFQASFFPDESGTILSVNFDFYGTWITYIGYFLLYIGMLAILFDKNTRFGEIKRKLQTVIKKKEKLAGLLVLLFGLSAFAQENHMHQKPNVEVIEKFIQEKQVDPKHADQFGRLVIQDANGRMKPIHTFSSELLRKVSKSDHYKGLNSDQVFISMTQHAQAWYHVPLINIKKQNDSLHKILGVKKGEKLIAMVDFFDEVGNYKLDPFLDDAYKAAVPNKFQEDFIDADRKVNLLHSALSGSILRIYPIPGDQNNKWISHLELSTSNQMGKDSTQIKGILPAYLMMLDDAIENKDYSKADQFLNGLKDFQKTYGSNVMPSNDKIEAEILYNNYDIFKNLFSWYMYAGVLMLIFAIVQILKKKKIISVLLNVFHVIIAILFVLHTLGLIARWYISGHAPWSDAYESMIYVAWATMFFTLAFNLKSKLTVASGTFVASMILMIAHWSWMDPAIANLQPVLNSYWLMIHVAVIVGSYGPFTLGMILGLVSLLLMIFTTKENKERMKLSIQEITYINEMALTIGLVMLTIGNFLGGQWANESWGRYWGWDPKETWALISIMVYAFVIHARFVPLFRGKWIFNLMSCLAFYSIMMTYFGVNFYLSGLHSYATGDQVVTPVEFYISLGILAVIASLAYYKNKKYLK